MNVPEHCTLPSWNRMIRSSSANAPARLGLFGCSLMADDRPAFRCGPIKNSYQKFSNNGTIKWSIHSKMFMSTTKFPVGCTKYSGEYKICVESGSLSSRVHLCYNGCAVPVIHAKNVYIWTTYIFLSKINWLKDFCCKDHIITLWHSIP